MNDPAAAFVIASPSKNKRKGIAPPIKPIKIIVIHSFLLRVLISAGFLNRTAALTISVNKAIPTRLFFKNVKLEGSIFATKRLFIKMDTPLIMAVDKTSIIPLVCFFMGMIETIYIFGNPILENDSLPFRLLSNLRVELPEIVFSELDPTEDFPETDTLYVIDTVINIQEVAVINDIESLEDSPHLSAHDADLAFNLKFLKKLGKLKGAVIFGVPAEGFEDEILKDLVRKIREFTRTT